VPDDLVGKNVDDARAELKQLGFKVNINEVEDADADPGQVLAVNPPGGTPVKSKSPVTLTVAKAPEGETTPTDQPTEEPTSESPSPSSSASPSPSSGNGDGT